MALGPARRVAPCHDGAAIRGTIAAVRMSSIDPSRLLAAIQAVQASFVASGDRADDEPLIPALREALALTGAAVGFVARVRRDPGREARLDRPQLLALAEDGDAAVLDWLGRTLASERLPRPLAGLPDARQALRLGYEPRLPAFDNLLAVPLRPRERTVAVLGLVNRDGGFDAALVESLAPFVATCNTVIAAQAEARARRGRDAELARAERRFRRFMDASQCVAYITDGERRVLWCSREFGRQFRVDPSAAIGRREDQLMPPSMAARTRAIDEQVRSRDDFVYMLEPAVGAAGEIHWWQGAQFPLEGADGEALIGGLAIDVTDNVRMTETLREREAELAEAQELARLGRWTWVVQRDRIGWDRQFERMCGLADADEHGLEALLGLLHPDDVEPTRRALEQAVSQGGARLILEHRLLVDGEVRELEVVARVRRESEAGPVVVAVAQDVSERRRLERSRRELEAKAERFESLSVLAGGMAQEFNGLLVGILGNAGIALDDLAHDSLAAACVQDIEAAAERAAQLTRQMLAFSGRGRFVTEALELSSLVAGLAESIHAAISDVVTVRLALHPDLPQIEGDRSQLRQLVLNLVVNGSEAIGDRPGELTLRTGVDDYAEASLGELVDGARLEPGRYVWLEVRDTGAGMDADTCARIFEPFYTTKLSGRGLGLAAVLGIARAHGGGVQVDSGLGRGASFRVLVPPLRGPAESSESGGWSRRVG